MKNMKYSYCWMWLSVEGQEPELSCRETAVTGNVTSPAYLLFHNSIMYGSDTQTYMFE